MVLTIKQGRTSHIEGVRPTDDKILYNIEMNCPAKTGKKENILALNLNPQLFYVDFYSNKAYKIFESEIDYEVVTDGSLTGEELYEVFEIGMDLSIKFYQISHAHLKSGGDKMFQPIPFDFLKEKLQEIVDWFEKD